MYVCRTWTTQTPKAFDEHLCFGDLWGPLVDSFYVALAQSLYTKARSGFSDLRAPICNRQHFFLFSLIKKINNKKSLLRLAHKPVSPSYLPSWHLQKPWGTRPVCPSQAASGRTGGSWRRTAPRRSTPAPFTRAPVLPWSPLSSRENQIPAKCLIQTVYGRNITTTTTTTKSNTKKQETHTRPTGRRKWASGTRSFREPTWREVTTCCRSGFCFCFCFSSRTSAETRAISVFYSLCRHLRAPAWIKDSWESAGAPRPSLRERN